MSEPFEQGYPGRAGRGHAQLHSGRPQGELLRLQRGQARRRVTGRGLGRGPLSARLGDSWTPTRLCLGEPVRPDFGEKSEPAIYCRQDTHSPWLNILAGQAVPSTKLL